MSRLFAAYVALKPKLGRGFGWGLHERLYRAARRLFDPRWVEVEGFKLHLDPYDDVFSYNLARGHAWEQAETRAFKSRLRPGMDVIDVGAHIGYYTLVASLAVGARGRVFAFEPEPRNLALLRRNVEVNACTNVRIVEQAVGAAPGRATLRLDPRNTGGHSLVARGTSAGELEVGCTDLDSWIEREGVRPAMLKIDVEGGERAVLEGLRRTLESPAPLTILMEYFPARLKQAGGAPVEVLELLSSYGFTLSVIESAPGVAGQSPAAITEIAERRQLVNLLCERGDGPGGLQVLT